MTARRLNCAVPGCKHTRGDRKGDPVGPGMEWVCGDHWSLVPRSMRAIYSRVKRKAKRWSDRPIAVHRIWQRCKREAIERGMGLK